MQTLTDEERELLIQQASDMCRLGATSSVQRYWWSILQNLIHGRSAQQIRKMEIAQNLRAA